MSYFKLPQTAFVLGLLVGACALAGPAGAADLDVDPAYADVPAPIPQQQVTFGSGWYVRGDIGATQLPDASLTGGAANTAPSVTLKNGSHLGYTASLGGGYAFNEWFRADITADMNQTVNSKKSGATFPASATSSAYTNDAGTCQTGYSTYATSVSTDTTVFYRPYYSDCTNQYQTNVTSYDVLVNGYIDLGHWWRVTPYVGAGIGLGFGHYSAASAYYLSDGTAYDVTLTDPGTGTTTHGYKDATYSANYYNFAFAAMAGVAIDVTDHAKLDIGYRYLNEGKVLGTTLSFHQVRAGLRYMIDN